MESDNQSSCQTCESSTCSAQTLRHGESEQEYAERQALQRRLCRIRHKILVLSGKGGVGKSTVAVNLAFSLARAGKRVGLLDVDFHGPSVPGMLGLEHTAPQRQGDAMLPTEINGVKVMSIGLLIENRDDAIIWRGPMKMGVIKQFLTDVAWGDLDYLIIDSPPGTGDEPLSVCQLIENADGAVVVTTPQAVATADVRRSISFCRRLKLPVLGVVENMSGFVCPKCGETTAIFQTGGGEIMAREMDVPFLGALPIDPRIVTAADSGTVYIEDASSSAVAEAFRQVVDPILKLSNA